MSEAVPILPDDPEPLPASLADYRILGVLGRGGMGTVYEAEQLDPRRRVALKVLHGGEFADDRKVALFRREIRALALLAHPGIASLYTSGSTPEGVHYFAMELVVGRPLDDWWRARSGLDTGPDTEIRHRVKLFLQVCDAVAFAHARGVIHRDLKPSNVFVCGGQGEEGIKVLDFGLARITEGEDGARSRLTEHGTVRGTLPYMSPEQLAGDPEVLDARSDVWALGVLLYGLLTDRHPYDEGGLSPFELPSRILNEPPRPIARSWTGRRRIDPDLATIVMKCLETQPARRYQTVHALADDLRRFRAGQPIVARPPNTAYQLRKMIGRNRIGFSVLAAGGLVITGAAVALAVLASHLAAERDRANREAEAARANAAAFSRVLLQRVPAMGLRRLDDPEAVASIVEEVARTWEGDPTGEIDVLRAAGVAVFESGSFEAGMRFLEKALEIEKRMEATWRRSGTVMTLGEMYHRAGRLSEAEELFRSIVEAHRAHPEPLSPRTMGYALENLGCARRDLGRLDEAERDLSEALRLYESEPNPDPGLLASVRNSLGNLYLARGDLERAGDEHRRSVALRQSGWAEGHPHLLASLHDLGRTLLRRGDLDEAESTLRKSLAGRERFLGPDHPDTAMTLGALGELEAARGRFDAARSRFDRAARIFRARLREDHPAAIALRREIERLDTATRR